MGLLSWLTKERYPVSAEPIGEVFMDSRYGKHATEADRDAANDRIKQDEERRFAREREEARTMMARVSDHPAWLHLTEFARAAGSGVGWGKNYRKGCGPGDWRGYYAYIAGTEDFLHGEGETLQLAIEDLAKIIRGRRISIALKDKDPKSWDVPPNIGIYQPEYPPGLSFVKEEKRGD